MDVLVVDDIFAAAESAAELIEARTSLRAVPVDDPHVAIEYASQYSVKVAVIDQKMPVMSGTDLYSEIRRVNPAIRAVMLTGEADADEVGSALRLGYADYLPKSQVSSLADMVLAQYMRYFAETSKAAAGGPDTVLTRRRQYVLFGPRIEYRLAASKVLDGKRVDPSTWTTIQTINVGEKKRLVIKSESKSALKIDSGSEETIKSTLNAAVLPFKSLSGKLEATVKETVNESVSAEYSVSEEIEQSVDLSEPTDISTLHVRSRHFQTAPIVVQLQLTIIRLCAACGQRTVLPISARYETGLLATRQVDYRSDGSREEIETGAVRRSKR